MNNELDPRLAHTGANVEGREILDDQVLLSDFERFLEIGERWENEEAQDKDSGAGEDVEIVWELMGFIDRHGRQLLELAKRGAGLN
jgi:hypothetical protein